jgi:hypothetical protein
MKSTDTTAKTLFNLLTSKDFNVTILDTEGKTVTNSAEARIFNFDYTSNGTDYGSVVVLLSPESSIDIFCGDSFGKSMSSDDKSNWYDFLYQMRMFAKRHLFAFSVKDMSKLKFTMKDIAASTASDPLAEGWTGNKRQSETAGPGGKTKLIIKHDKQINDEAGDKRYRNIDKLFIESESGERFAVPTKNLTCGRMLARHVAEGGTPYDDKGKHICCMVDDIQKLSKFVRSTQNKEVPADTKVLVEKAVEHYNQLKHHAKSIVSQKGYHTYFDNWSADSAVEADADLEPLRELFTNKAIDARVENALPILSKINKQGSDMSLTNQYESWANNLAEGTWSMPDTPEKEAKLKELFAEPIVYGIDAQNVTGLLYDLIGDDELFDLLDDSAEDPDADARETIAYWLEDNMPEVYAKLDYKHEEVEEGFAQNVDSRQAQDLQQHAANQKWNFHKDEERLNQDDERETEEPVGEDRSIASVMADATNLYGMMKSAIAGQADRKEPFDWLAQLRQTNGNDYAMQVYKKAQALVNSNKTVGESVDETDPVISPSTQSKREQPAKKQVSAKTRIQNAYKNGEFIGVDHIAMSKDGTFIFRRGYYYAHGGSAEKFAAKVDNMLTAVGIPHEIVDQGDHWAPFKGGGSIKTQTHWWAKVRILDDAPVEEDFDYDAHGSLADTAERNKQDNYDPYNSSQDKIKQWASQPSRQRQVKEDGVEGVTPAAVADAWYSVFPNSLCNARDIMGDMAYKFRLAKDKSEVASGIFENDPLSYSAFIRNGNWEESTGSLSIAPEAGSYMAYGSARLRKKTIKNVTKEQLVKRFKEVHAFISANADKLHNIKFDIADKLGSSNVTEATDKVDSYGWRSTKNADGYTWTVYSTTYGQPSKTIKSGVESSRAKAVAKAKAIVGPLRRSQNNTAAHHNKTEVTEDQLNEMAMDTTVYKGVKLVLQAVIGAGLAIYKASNLNMPIFSHHSREVVMKKWQQFKDAASAWSNMRTAESRETYGQHNVWQADDEEAAAEREIWRKRHLDDKYARNRDKTDPMHPGNVGNELEEAKDDVHTIDCERKGRTRSQTGTLAELIEYYRYTLETGKSYERERGNSKINLNPKTIDQLVKNLNNAKSNSAANGYSSEYYSVGFGGDDSSEYDAGFGPGEAGNKMPQ